MSTVNLLIHVDNGPTLFNDAVTLPGNARTSLREILELAYNQTETAADPHPFRVYLEYFGYSQTAQYPSLYLGYEIEQIDTYKVGNQPDGGYYYWEIKVDDVETDTGIDMTYPAANSSISLTYVEFQASGDDHNRKTAIKKHREVAKRA